MTSKKIIPATTSADQLHNAMIDVRRYSEILATCDQIHREFVHEHLQIAIERVETITNELTAVKPIEEATNVKRVTAEVVANTVTPSYNFPVWTDNDLYAWLSVHDCVWLAGRGDWMNLAAVTIGNRKHMVALRIIYKSEDSDIEDRYLHAITAFLKVQSMGYTWDDTLKAWIIDTDSGL